MRVEANVRDDAALIADFVDNVREFRGQRQRTVGSGSRVPIL